jgi:hypothetical protein
MSSQEVIDLTSPEVKETETETQTGTKETPHSAELLPSYQQQNQHWIQLDGTTVQHQHTRQQQIERETALTKATAKRTSSPPGPIFGSKRICRTGTPKFLDTLSRAPPILICDEETSSETWFENPLTLQNTRSDRSPSSENQGRQVKAFHPISAADSNGAVNVLADKNLIAVLKKAQNDYTKRSEITTFIEGKHKCFHPSITKTITTGRRMSPDESVLACL